jgi:AcrR family transcriptional regulator
MKRTRLVSRRSREAPEAAPPPLPPAEEGGRRPGRPRSEEAHGAILDAAIALIREVGYDAVAMDAIAARAGVGKATVYRRWSAKELLVAEAIEGIVRAIPVPDTGSTRGDVLALMRAVMGMYQDPSTGLLLSGLVAAMARSTPIAQAVRSGMVAKWHDAMRAVLTRGVARGELRAGLDVELAIDLLAGPLFYRYLMLGQQVDERLVRGVMTHVLRGLSAPEKARRNEE